MQALSLIPGSERSKLEIPKFALSDPRDQVVLTLTLRRISEPPTEITSHFSVDDHAAHFGASLEDIAKVTEFAKANGFPTSYQQRSRRVQLWGRLDRLQEVFGVTDLNTIYGPYSLHRVRSGSIYAPAELEGIVVSVHGFDTRPVAQSHFRRNTTVEKAQSTSSYTPAQIAKRYNFPGGDGDGQTVAVIELGGGYSDLSAAWKLYGIPDVKVTSFSVGGVNNAPTGDPGSADGEVCLDIEVIGGIVPKASIQVWFTSNTDAGFLNAINDAIHNQIAKPTAISISWGGPESSWTKQSLDAFNATFHDAALLGITVTVAAGDNGSDDGVGDGGKHVDFPGSSPWVWDCGGTRTEGDKDVVWNDGDGGGATGGGYSSYFLKPSYQNLPGVKYRGCPDSSGDASPYTGYQTVTDGVYGDVGGTSAVAPLMAALAVLLSQQMGKPVGFILPILYKNPGAFVDVTDGGNGYFVAAPGWDPASGLGVPDGEKILAALKG